MAGTVGQGAQILGNALIPETMQNFRNQGLMEQAQKASQVGDIQGRRLMSGYDAQIGAPQTKSYQVNGRTIGQDNASTVQPLFSQSKKNALFAAQAPDAARADRISQLSQRMNPPKPEVKAYNPGQVVGTQTSDGTFTPTFTVPTPAAPPEFLKRGTTRNFQRGGATVTQEADGAGGWKDLAEGPAWKPDGDTKKAWRILSEAEAVTAGLPKGGTYKTNGEDFAVVVQPKQDSPTAGENTAAYHGRRLASGLQLMTDVLGKNKGAITSPVPGNNLLSKKLRGGDENRIQSVLPEIGDALLTLGTGAAYTVEQFNNQWTANLPAYGDDDNVLADKLGRVEALYDQAKRNARGAGVDLPAFESLAALYRPKGGEMDAAPPGVSSDIWGAMTPQEKALWLSSP